MQICSSFVTRKCKLGQRAEKRETDRNEILNQISIDYTVI